MVIHAIANPHDRHGGAVSIRARQVVVVGSKVRLLAARGPFAPDPDPACFSRFPADPAHPLLPTLAFTRPCLKINLTARVQLISSSHTFPLFWWPPDGPNTLTHLPEAIQSISVPVVPGGSCSSSVAVESAALLCCAKTSVPTRLCAPLVFFLSRETKQFFNYGTNQNLLELLICMENNKTSHSPTDPLCHTANSFYQ